MDHLAGGRLIIGLIASLHVLINHPLAVGAYPLLTWMEWWAHKNNRPDIDRLAYRITFIVFIVTTTVGSMMGVGIWLSTSLFAPFAIGSLLRVFFWGWFLEWLVFISEVALICWWFLSWKKADTAEKKKKHIRIGVALSIMSWLTMALIVAVLGFMMKPGEWRQTRAFLDAMTNPLYVPQLGFRTFFALMTAAVFIWFAAFFFTKTTSVGDDRPRRLRRWIVYRMSHVVLVSLLRPASTDAARGAWSVLRLLAQRLREAFPGVRLILRGDSGFCRWRMLRWCEHNDIGYIVGLARNTRLEALLAPTLAEAQAEFKTTQTKVRKGTPGNSKCSANLIKKWRGGGR